MTEDQEKQPESQSQRLAIDDLSLREAVYIHTLMNIGASEDYEKIRPVGEIVDALAPTPLLAAEIVAVLLKRRIIRIDEDSSSCSGGQVEEGRIDGDLMSVSFRPSIAETTESTLCFLTELRSRLAGDAWPHHWHTDFPSLLEEVALHESLNLLKIAMRERGLRAPHGEKTKANLRVILKSCSVGQASYIILKSATMTVDYLAKGQVPRYQAESSVSSRLLRTYQYWVDKGREVPTHNRYGKAPESELSLTVCRLMLRGGTNWFKTPIPQMLTDWEARVASRSSDST